MTASLVGTGTLARLAVRRDRVLLPVGILGITIFAVSSAKATLALYPTVASMDAGIKTIFASPSAVALYGPISDPTDPDALAARGAAGRRWVEGSASPAAVAEAYEQLIVGLRR